ncbi:hypothetical protein CEP54_000290 [Fusarium duplospermum]|uniref:Histidine-specific methyltransferase SAM-dependent domain-containing protein n=1 Tax=Fusarium duplospermum TaxID=1325734 RepID=A0A428R8S3_9HYPO|nr:hypothetical protein CEP54_000290 [Fusarium duplospermum]
MSGYEEKITSTDPKTRVFKQDTPSEGEFHGSAPCTSLPRPLPQSLPCTPDLLPPKKGQVKDVIGRVLEKSIENSLRRSLTEGTYLGKEIFYLGNAWPGGSNQTDGETEILKALAPDIFSRVRACPIIWIFELGAGDSTKMSILLDLFELKGIKCYYCRVDINEELLKKNVRQLNKKYTYVECSGLLGTFEHGLAMAAAQAGKKVITSLGSTLLNLDNSQALKNLRGSCRDNNMVIIGHQGPEAMTGRDGEELHRASYHTKEYDEFIRGALRTGNEALGKEVFNAGEWEIGCAITPKGPWSHDFIFYHQGEERFRAFSSKKFNEQEVSDMFKMVGAPSPEIHRHSKTAMRIYVVDCLRE